MKKTALLASKMKTQVDDKAKETLSASYRRLKSVAEENNPVDKPKKTSTANSDSTITWFRFFDMEVLYNVLSLLKCYECVEMDVLFMEDELDRKGCASSLRLLCENRGWKNSFYTSKQQGKR